MLSDHQHGCPLAHYIAALEPVGWRVVEIRPNLTDGTAALWRVTIERHDRNVSMTVTEANPDEALAELTRYAQADAKGAESCADTASAGPGRRAR